MSRLLLTLALSALAGACGGERALLHVPAPDALAFEQAVYPVLLRDCGFPACHGNTQRFLQVFGPGRARLGAATEHTDFYAPATAAELTLTYERARSMLAFEAHYSEGLLLRKPLSVQQGGASHEGRDRWGNNVYRSRDASGFRTLLAWARIAAEAPP